MKFRKHWEPARTYYRVSAVLKRGERINPYTPNLHRTKAAAQKEANAINQRRPEALAQVEVKEVKAGVVWSGTLRL